MLTIPSSRLRRCRIASTLGVLFLLAALPASAFGQASRTWVSGLGDDANPCSRTAPCKTFAGAEGRTAAGGEIDAQDPGGYGTVTITKALTISGRGTQASIIGAGNNGIVVNAAPTDNVIIDDIQINGFSTGLAGIKVLQARTVHVRDSHVFGFGGPGIDFQPGCSAASTGRLVVDNTTVENNGGAGVQSGESPTCTSAKVTLTNDHVDQNGCGIVAGGTCGAGAGGNVPVMIDSINTSVIDNSNAGVESIGGTAANVISRDLITGNATGIQTLGGVVFSFGNNEVFGNTTDGSPNGSIVTRSRDISEARIWTRLKSVAAKLKRHHHGQKK